MSRPQDRIQKSEGPYADADSYADKSVMGAGAYAGAGLGHVKAERDGVETEANEPNASAGAQASLYRGLSAMAGAEVGSVSVASDPLKVKVGLGVDTEVSAGPDGLEVQMLGTGGRIGPNPKVSVLGSSVECSVM